MYFSPCYVKWLITRLLVHHFFKKNSRILHACEKVSVKGTKYSHNHLKNLEKQKGRMTWAHINYTMLWFFRFLNFKLSMDKGWISITMWNNHTVQSLTLFLKLEGKLIDQNMKIQSLLGTGTLCWIVTVVPLLQSMFGHLSRNFVCLFSARKFKK